MNNPITKDMTVGIIDMLKVINVENNQTGCGNARRSLFTFLYKRVDSSSSENRRQNLQKIHWSYLCSSRGIHFGGWREAVHHCRAGAGMGRERLGAGGHRLRNLSLVGGRCNASYWTKHH